MQEHHILLFYDSRNSSFQSFCRIQGIGQLGVMLCYMSSEVLAVFVGRFRDSGCTSESAGARFSCTAIIIYMICTVYLPRCILHLLQYMRCRHDILWRTDILCCRNILNRIHACVGVCAYICVVVCMRMFAYVCVGTYHLLVKDRLSLALFVSRNVCIARRKEIFICNCKLQMM